MLTRLEATEKGLTTFNTGKPCRVGHLSDRYTANGQCKECLRIQNEARQESYKLAKGRRNMALVSGLQEQKFMVHGNHRDNVQLLCDILQFGTIEQIAKAADTIQKIHNTCAIPKSLNRAEISTFLALDENSHVAAHCVSRIHLMLVPDRSDSGKYILAFNGYTYALEDCIAVLKGDQLIAKHLGKI